MSGALATLHQDLQDLVGRTIAGRYRVESLLGVGGMAAVFRAHHEGLGRDVAIKVLHPNLSVNEEMSARFDREARSASRLDHPNCVQVTDFGSTDDGMKYMVMQLLEGGELTAKLGKRLTSPRAVELVLQILRGLEHAHGKGVVHRDIKPENVFVTTDHDGDEVLKLVDFGIAKLTGAGSGDTHKTTAGLVFGTPAYMSPEQAMGVEADSRADLYSVGVLFYQMLAGRVPIDSDDPVALVRMQVSVDPDPLPSSVPPVVAAVVGRLMEKDRDKRFQAATEVIETLEGIEPLLVDEHISEISMEIPAANTGTTSVLLEPMAGAASSAKPLSRKWLLPAIGGAALLIGAAIAVVLAGGDDDSADVEVTQTRTAVSTDEGADPVDSASVAGPPSGKLAEIERLLLAKKWNEANELLGPLRDEFPDDATLKWRYAQVLSAQRRKQSQALQAYGDALEADPAFIDDKDFYAELHDIMRDKRVRAEALDFALQQMGDSGHKFLLEMVNDERSPLQYTARHRALDALDEDPENAPLVNEKLNMALDVLQAAASVTPCKNYADALSAIEAKPDFYFYNRVDKANLPTAPEDAEQETADDVSVCPGLPARREALLAQLAVLNPDAEAAVEGDETDAVEADSADEADKPARAGGKKKKSQSSSKDCSKFLGGLKKKCRR
ncbi:MAG: protein kinase [Myxococcota bacterium]